MVDENIQDDNYYLETDSSMLKLTAPVARMKFFIYILIQLFIGLGIYSATVLFGALLFPVIIIGCLFLIYVYFVTASARLWDITGNKTIAIILCIVLGIICYFFKIFDLIYLLCLFFISGKLIKS